jgi:aminopeptidase N
MIGRHASSLRPAVRRVRKVAATRALLLIAGFLAFGPSRAALAQTQGPEDIADELARAKARHYRLLMGAESSATANQDDFDVSYYLLDLDFDTSSEIVSGSVEMRAVVAGTSIDAVDLNLKDNMSVSSVMSGAGMPLGFTHASDLLSIDLDRTYSNGEMVVLTVTYSGDPSGDAFDFGSRSGKPMIWSLSEPFGARDWWPCKDVPSDKADSVDVKFTVPAGMIAASNGLLVDSTTVSGRTTFWWHESYPISTYLVSIAAYEYTTFSDYYAYSPADSMEIQFFVFPDHYAGVQTNYGKTADMIAAYASMFGEYPFIEEKYGHAEFLWGGGMEHQTITSLGGYGESLIAHELAHMWWGDMITCKDFHHIWVNEGFATYCEALWNGQEYGEAYYHQDMELAKYFGPGTIYVPDTSDFNRIFNSGLSYNKGSWVLHMLRHVVGDSTFFDILHAYYADPSLQYGNAGTEEFEAVCEAVSGIDLSAFFHQWIYEEYYPVYSYSWSSSENGGSYTVHLTIEQLQSNTVFEMPIDVTVTSASGDTTFVVSNTSAYQSYNLTLDEEPTSVQLDKDDWILKEVEEPLANATLDHGILLVNGVSWSVYGSEATSAYADSAFWGRFPVAFWDCFDEPAGGYPSSLPVPNGHGPVPPDTLGRYSTVIWVGNNYSGDLADWQDTSIMSYLKAGGNVLLMSRMGTDFLNAAMTSYLGLTWAESNYNTISDCVSRYSGLGDMSPSGNQSYVSVFDTSLASAESVLLFAETSSFGEERGLGVWHDPAWPGGVNPYGGQFVFLSGRPYRWNHAQLRANVEYILENFLREGGTLSSPGGGPTAGVFKLYQNYPNPFSTSTVVSFYAPTACEARVSVFDPAGREIAVLLDGKVRPGLCKIPWSGTSGKGKAVPSGVYFYSVRADRWKAAGKMTIAR